MLLLVDDEGAIICVQVGRESPTTVLRFTLAAVKSDVPVRAAVPSSFVLVSSAAAVERAAGLAHGCGLVITG